MIRISGIKVPEGSDMEHVRNKAARLLGIRPEEVRELTVLKSSRDARRKNSILDVYTAAVAVENEKKVLQRADDRNISLLEEIRYSLPVKGSGDKGSRPVIAGFGPAGIFASLILAQEGMRPVVYERGKQAEERAADVERFFKTGVLDPDSNVQFGEGGAGSFSDGKLSTGIKDREGRKGFILETLVRHGADSSILTDAHPHIGTDRLIKIIPSIRREIEGLGGEIHFKTALTGIEIKDGRLTGIRLSGEDGLIRCDSLFLCLGHSARDTFFMLHDMGLAMEAKPFAVGVRAEHRREIIDGALHREKADYKLTYHCRDGRGVYSFCMCPGGYVVNASSEEGHLTVNGMSYSGRDGINSNAAIVCTIAPGDFAGYGDDALSGVRFQRELERRTFLEAGGLVP
ncbi:MAG: FAD-dependent oxidoreductase, partial [Lachnospiraceae bacterium]|nr:FAD-dependent oxidoreductase [Lachnospiraceae bacterium]